MPRYVLRLKDNDFYMATRKAKLGITRDLQRARVFTNKTCAMSALCGASPDYWEFVPVKLVEIKDDASV